MCGRDCSSRGSIESRSYPVILALFRILSPDFLRRSDGIRTNGLLRERQVREDAAEMDAAGSKAASRDIFLDYDCVAGSDLEESLQ